MLRKLFPFLNKSHFNNAYVNVHKWLTPQNQLNMHRIATNFAVTLKDREKQIEMFLNKHANVGQLTHQISVSYKLKDFAKYVVKTKMKMFEKKSKKN